LFDVVFKYIPDLAVQERIPSRRRVKQMLLDEKAEKPRPPSEPPVPDAATKRLKTLGTLTIQASSLLAKRQASAGVMREGGCSAASRGGCG